MGRRSPKDLLQHKDHMTCLAHTLGHFENGFIIVTFGPSLNIVEEDSSRSPSDSILCSA